MVRPVFILLSHSSALDPLSGLLSIIEIADKIIFTPPRKTEGDNTIIVLPYRPLRVVAVWMLEEVIGDRYEDTYEHEFGVFLPGGEQLLAMPATQFVFGVRTNDQFETRPLHRFQMRIDGPMPFKEPGVMRLESRIRKVGTEAWLAQDYPFFVEVAKGAEANEKPPGQKD